MLRIGVGAKRHSVGCDSCHGRRNHSVSAVGTPAALERGMNTDTKTAAGCKAAAEQAWREVRRLEAMGGELAAGRAIQWRLRAQELECKAARLATK